MAEKKTKEEFEKEFEEYSHGEYELLSDYVNARTKVEVKHLLCGHTYETLPQSILRNCCCPYCSGRTKKTTEQFSKEVKELTNGKYELVGKYKDRHTKCEIKHIECGHTYFVTPGSFLYGTRCPYCKPSRKLSTNEIRERIEILGKDEYELVGEYVNSDTKISILHKECGQIFDMRVADFVAGKRCPHCASSKGSKLVKDVLEANNVKYKCEYTFPDCRGKLPLRFDFGIVNEDKVLGLIEYDGIQHFQPVKYFGGEEHFKAEKENDKIKDNYCETHNIPLLRIPYTYTNEDAENKIVEFLHKISDDKE